MYVVKRVCVCAVSSEPVESLSTVCDYLSVVCVRLSECEADAVSYSLPFCQGGVCISAHRFTRKAAEAPFNPLLQVECL